MYLHEIFLELCAIFNETRSFVLKHLDCKCECISVKESLKAIVLAPRQANKTLNHSEIVRVMGVAAIFGWWRHKLLLVALCESLDLLIPCHACEVIEQTFSRINAKEHREQVAK